LKTARLPVRVVEGECRSFFSLVDHFRIQGPKIFSVFLNLTPTGRSPSVFEREGLESKKRAWEVE